VGVDYRKGLGRGGRGQKMCGHGRATMESAGRRLGKRGVADRRGPQTSEDERQTGGQH
jgi:hypothetical protein